MERQANTSSSQLSATQLLLNVLREAQRPLTIPEIFDTVCRIAGNLSDKGLAVNVVCRLGFSEHAWSEDVEESLWYWVANGFVTEVDGQDGLTLSASGRRLLEDHDLLSSIGADLDDQTMAWLKTGIEPVREETGAKADQGLGIRLR